MNGQHKYRASDKMSDLICDNYSLLMVMSRFGLSLGFGDKSVKDVCEAQGVEVATAESLKNYVHLNSSALQYLQMNVTMKG